MADRTLIRWHLAVGAAVLLLFGAFLAVAYGLLASGGHDGLAHAVWEKALVVGVPLAALAAAGLSLSGARTERRVLFSAAAVAALACLGAFWPIVEAVRTNNG